MLLSLARAKILLGITGTDATRDALISAMLPIIQNDVMVETSQSFQSGLYNSITTATFDNSAGTLVDADSNFLEEDFPESNIDIQVYGSLYNDGYYGVATATASTLTLETGWTFYDESVTNITVDLLRYPISLEKTAAKMLGYHLRGNNGTFSKLNLNIEKSESLGDHSITYQDIANAAGSFSTYPNSIQAELNAYRRVRFP